ncbi:MAG: TIGR00269 family protein [Nanoarchaeota archaeon]
MKCSKCSEVAVIKTESTFCKKHFIDYFEEKVQKTIEQFSLLNKKQKICVACSGGKDSTALLYLLNKWGYDVEALAVDEGIAGYRDVSLEDLKAFCSKNKIKLRIVSYKQNFNTTLDEYLIKNKDARPCTVCGVWRRNLLNKESQSYDVIATGHNLDDEAQSIMMNLLKSNISVMARLGPKSGIIEDKAFTPRVKPLYFVMEKETAAYALIKGFSVKFTECPNSFDSFRAKVRDWLNEIEAVNPGAKRNVLDWFLNKLPQLKEHHKKLVAGIHRCNECGEPSMGEICAACRQSRIIVNVQ